MRVFIVIDSINDIKNKIEKIKLHYGNKILFIVKADLVEIFKTYNYTPNAVYVNNCANIIHEMMSKLDIENSIIYYSSLNLTNNLLKTFNSKIGTGAKVVNVMPKYNFFEKIWHSLYNIYVKILFKNKDALSSAKLQFLPKDFVYELIKTHVSNRLFELNNNLVITINYADDKQVNKTLKPKIKFNKNFIIPLIVFLAITFLFILTAMLTELKYFIILIYISLYLLNIIISIILCCKKYFDNRFFK